MLGMRILIGPNFSFGASCGPIEALQAGILLALNPKAIPSDGVITILSIILC